MFCLNLPLLEFSLNLYNNALEIPTVLYGFSPLFSNPSFFYKGRRVEDPIYQLILPVAMVKMLPGSRYTGCFRGEHLDPGNVPTLCLSSGS